MPIHESVASRALRALLRPLAVATLSLCVGVGAAQAGSYEDSLEAARLGDTSELVELLDRGIDPDTVDASGNTLLILAAREGRVDTVQALLKYRPRLAYRNGSGDSALMLAVLRGHEAVVDALLQAGAPVHHDGWAPLHYAAYEGHVALVDKLLAAGAPADALAPNKSSALMLAARNGHIDVVRRLLPLPIDLEQKNDSGFTAESWALEGGNTDIAELIRTERGRRGGRAQR